MRRNIEKYPETIETLSPP